MKTIEIKTSRRSELVNITSQVRRVVREAGVSEGVVHLWSFHTTCGLTVNEGADPDVARDIDWKLSELVPHGEAAYRHAEGNSDSHVKTALVNPAATLLVDAGDIALGTWQAVFLVEFDGPRTRRIGVQVMAAR